MAFPSVRSQNTTPGTVASATPVVDLPATIRAGDVLFVSIRVAVAGAIGWPAGWNELFDNSADGDDDQIAGAWRKADGTEGSTITLSSGNGKFVAFSYAIRDAADPLITAPFLNSQQIGTSAAQPDPGNCAPDVTARDYLFLTLFLMGGESTGITSYPANYTLNQSGFISSGTGGAATTNCRAGAACRQLNASGDNAGAWTIGGTLGNWSAYTLAFYPASPVTAPLDREASNHQATPFTTIPKSSLGLAGLTLAVNLLQSTLAPAEPMGSNQYDWPLPQSKHQYIVETYVQQADDADLPVIPIDWRNPDLWKYSISNRTELNNLLQNTLKPEEALPYVTIDTNPLIGRRPTETWIEGRKEYYIDESPFNQYDWPNPLIKGRGQDWIWKREFDEELSLTHRPIDRPNPLLAIKPALSWIQNGLITEDLTRAVQFTDNPLIGGRNQVGFIFSRQLEPPTEFPFIPVDYPNPLLGKRPNVGSESARPQYYEDEYRATQSYPTRFELKRGQDWISNSLQNTLQPVIGNQWTEYKFKKVIPTEFSYINLLTTTLLSTEAPMGEQSYTNPTLRTKPLPNTWLQNRPTYYVEPTSIPGGKLFDITRRRIPQLEITINTRPEPAPIVFPFSQKDWQNPRGKKLNPKWEDFYTIDQTFPDIHQFTTLPQPRKRVIPFTWLQAPLISSPVFTPPTGKQIWTVPDRLKKQAITWLQNSLSVSAVPFNEPVWNNPRVNKYALTWIQQRPFFSEEPLPFSQKDWTNPSHIHYPDVSFLLRAQIEEVTPLINIEWVNPQNKQKIAETWLVNFSALTQPPAGDTPFGQGDWPNPHIDSIELGFVWSKPFYYQDPTEPFYQTNWPLFNSIKRNKVDWIYRIPINDTLYINVSITEVPLRKRVEGLTWINNNLENSLSTAFFNRQSDWPIPLRGKINRVDFTQDLARFLDSKIPFRFVEWPVSKKREIAKVWIDNPLINLTTPVGIKPFSESDWPLFSKSKYVAAVYIVQNQLALIIPNIVGRHICLFADATEYNLLAAMDLLDYIADVTEYNLEAGGSECP